MKRKSLLILIFGIFAVFWAIGTYNVSYAACSNCKAGKHTSCSSKGYTQVENPTWHYIYCCCGKVAQQHENHTVSGYLNTSTYCYKCVCGYKALHNKSGGYCSKAHCPYHSSKRLCSRGCKHAKWVNCVGHTYGSWKYDATNHWKKCTYSSSCTATSSKGAHIDGNSDGKCDVCGYKMKINVTKPTATTTSFTYTGSVQSIVFSGFSSSTMTLSGGSATNAGSYTATVSLNNTATHQWADGTTGNLSFTWTINRASISVPTGKNYTYDGSSKTGVSSGTGYSLAGTVTATNAGNYTATATLDSNHQWSDNTTVTKNISWSISRAIATEPTVRNCTYNGSYQTGVSAGTGCTLSGTTSAINAASYTAYATPDSNHQWSDGGTGQKSYSWTIYRAKISSTPTGNNLVYNGSSQTGVTGASGYNLSGTTSALHVGNYTAYATPDTNHSWSDGTTSAKTISWSITKKSTTINWQNTTLHYNESSQKPTASATGVGNDKISVSVSGAQTIPGTYIATAFCTVTGNGYASDYNFTNPSTSYVIKNGIIEGSVTITGTNMIGETLTARLSVTKPTNGTTASYQWYSNTSNSTTGGTAINGATSATYTIGKGLVDKYIYVVATVSKQYYDTNTFKDITDGSNGTAVVSRKSMTIPTITGTYIYNGTEQIVLLNNFDSATMNVSNNTRIDAGTQSVTVGLKDPANYKWSDNTTASKNISWTIETKKVTAVWGSKTTFTYNGKEQAPEVTADSGIAGETLNLTRTAGINAGTYTSVATIVSVTGGRGKVSNYTLLNSTISYTINKAECKIVLTKTHLDLLKNQTKTVGYTYNGDGALSVSVANTTIANATINTTNKLVSVTGVTEGNTTVTVRGSAGTNYLATSASFTVVVHPSPTIESVKINNGATTTKNVEVVMEIKATSISEMYVSNSNETPNVNAAGWVDYKLYSKHKLTWQNGAKTVYVWGKDEFDNMTVVSTAGITLDARYSLSLKNNQEYLGRLESSSRYAIKADDGGWQWQDSSVFTNLVPVTVYTLKTQLYDIVGITGDSEEIKLRAVYDNDGKLYIEHLN